MQIIKKLRKFVLLILVTLSIQISFSQENFLPGLMINSTGDTLHGFIDYRNWVINPNRIIFKDKLDGVETVYTTSDVTEFHVLDEIYVSAIVNSEVSTTVTEKLQYDTELNLKIDTVFIQTLFEGNKCLYYFDHPPFLIRPI